jgi:hypothetical protein
MWFFSCDLTFSDVRASPPPLSRQASAIDDDAKV